jgi:hypothetical protein
MIYARLFKKGKRTKLQTIVSHLDIAYPITLSNEHLTFPKRGCAD